MPDMEGVLGCGWAGELLIQKSVLDCTNDKPTRKGTPVKRTFILRNTHLLLHLGFLHRPLLAAVIHHSRDGLAALRPSPRRPNTVDPFVSCPCRTKTSTTGIWFLQAESKPRCLPASSTRAAASARSSACRPKRSATSMRISASSCARSILAQMSRALPLVAVSHRAVLCCASA